MKEITDRARARRLNLAHGPDLRAAIGALMDQGSRINVNKSEQYWYPLSIATYGVDEVVAAVDSLCSFRTTMWGKTAEFEQRFAAMQGSREAVMVNSGSSADLLIAFASVDPGRGLLARGDELLVPSVTWPTQIWSAMMAGLTVRFVDTDPHTLNMDLEDLERKIGPRTRGVFVVHLMGNPNDMARIQEICRRYDLVLLEDCCEALSARYDGRPVGGFGMASSFSFFFSHHITTMEGGMICTDDAEFADLLRLLRAHGWARNTRHMTRPDTDVDPRYVFMNWGFNLRPTEIQAAFGLEQLERLPAFTEARQRNVAHALALFSAFEPFMTTMRVLPKAQPSWFALPFVLSADAPFAKADLVRHLEANGVETRPIVAGNLARQPVCERFPQLQGSDLPGADAIHDRGFYIGLYPIDAGDQLDRVAETIDGFVRAYV